MAHLKTRRFGPVAPGPARQLVIIAHGLGANGSDLIPLAQSFAQALPHALFLAPDAPEACDLVSPEEGRHARQWFSLGDWRPEAMEAELRRGAPALDRFIDESLAEHRIPAADYALVGFSQGAMMSLFVGLRRRTPPRAILAYSGILLGPERLAEEIANQAPVLLVHGARDEVVPAEFSRMAEARLRGLSVPVELLIEPDLGHAIDETGLAAGTRCLGRAFPAVSGPA